jgi:hypothetical protein
MFTPASISEGLSARPVVVVPAFNGNAERFVLRAFRLFRRSLLQVNGDAGKVLGKHLRMRVPADAVDRMLGDLASLLIEIHVLEDRAHACASVAAKWSSKHEFFLIAMIEASQRGDMARATEAAIALLDTFQVGGALEASRAFAQRLDDFNLHLMPIGDAAFNYFADYKPLQEPALQRPPQPLDPLAAPLRLVASGAGYFRHD